MKIYLSPPNLDNDEIENVNTALTSGWISPFGSFIDDFSENLSKYFNRKVLLTNSGTSSIHLALISAGIKENDYVLCSNFTFAASAFPILYQKAIPVFIGSEEKTWNLSPEFLSEAIIYLKKKNIKPKALILTHIYGTPSLLYDICKICGDNEIILIEDSAEALGSTYNNIPLGGIGDYGILSFNGNKIVTCSTGGAIILKTEEEYDYVKKIAAQAKEKADYYVHNELGFNYAQSNILAAIGLAQFKKLNKKIDKRRKLFQDYLHFFQSKKTIAIYQQETENCFSNRWLSSFVFKENNLNIKIKKTLEENKIESRYLWNPLHKQKIFKDYLFFGNKNFDEFLFNNGLSFPSGDGLDKEGFEKIINSISLCL